MNYEEKMMLEDSIIYPVVEKTERKKTNVVLTPEESTKLKAFCGNNGIPFFRTEYWDKRYCQMEVTTDERKLVDEFLQTL